MNITPFFNETHSVPMKSVVFQRITVVSTRMIDIAKSYVGKENRGAHLAHEAIAAI